MKIGLILLFIFVPCIAKAQDFLLLPDKPEPQPIIQARPTGHAEHVFDTEFKIETVALAGSWLNDVISTHEVLMRCPTCYEGGIFFHGDRSTLKPALASAGFDASLVIGSYLLKKYVHNRWLGPLWRAPILYETICHVQATVHNYNMQ
jgi:hypothetical protein